MPTVVVIEDERDIQQVVRRYLERAGCGVLVAATGAEGMRIVSESDPDLVVLDLGVPDLDGMELLQWLATISRVVVLTARSATEERIAGLEAGADDYVVKPFSPRELVLRVESVLRRSGSLPTDTHRSLGSGTLVIDELRHEVLANGTVLELTVSEWRLLLALADSPGRVLSRLELVNRIHGYEFHGYERSIDSHIKNIRHKLAAVGIEAIETVVGVGYRMRLSRDE